MRLFNQWLRWFSLGRRLRHDQNKLENRRPADDLPAASQLTVPRHLAVIMDGNGRWARQRGLPRQAGHRAGAEKLQDLCRMCGQRGIEFLTVHAFSTENWSRPEHEVHTLMELFVEFFTRYDTELAREGIRVRFSGDLAGLPANIREIIERAELDSAGRDRMQLIIAINYGGRRELVHARRRLAEQVASGGLPVDAIDESSIQQALYLPDIPDPDLIIRPSGEQRLSNFLLWQSAYSELWFANVLWPDFSEQDLDAALQAYQQRERRFGGVTEK